jgi:transposase
VQQYSNEFKVTAVRLSHQPGLEVQAVARALDIHPFMLSKWRKDVRDGRLRGRSKAVVPPRLKHESQRLQQLEREHALLQTEHALLKKAIRFCSDRRQTRSPSSTASGARSR